MHDDTYKAMRYLCDQFNVVSASGELDRFIEAVRNYFPDPKHGMSLKDFAATEATTPVKTAAYERPETTTEVDENANRGAAQSEGRIHE